MSSDERTPREVAAEDALDAAIAEVFAARQEADPEALGTHILANWIVAADTMTTEDGDLAGDLLIMLPNGGRNTSVTTIVGLIQRTTWQAHDTFHPQ